jgi:hypothetical protein
MFYFHEISRFDVPSYYKQWAEFYAERCRRDLQIPDFFVRWVKRVNFDIYIHSQINSILAVEFDNDVGGFYYHCNDQPQADIFFVLRDNLIERRICEVVSHEARHLWQNFYGVFHDYWNGQKAEMDAQNYSILCLRTHYPSHI